MIKPDTQVPELKLPLTIGAEYHLAKQDPDTFTLVVMYRGKHCPICKKQLEALGDKLGAFTEAGVNPVAVSMDDKERAMVVDGEWKTGDLPLAYDMSEETAREWGLFISQKRPDSDEPEKFSEPGLFLVKPDGKLYYSSIQNSPFARPSLDDLLEAIKFVTEKDYPTRGTLT